MALRVSSATPLLGSALGALGIGAASAAAGQVLYGSSADGDASAHHHCTADRPGTDRRHKLLFTTHLDTGLHKADTSFLLPTSRVHDAPIVFTVQAFRHVRAEFGQEQRPGHAGRRPQPQPLWAGVRRQDLLIDALGGVLLWRVSLCINGTSWRGKAADLLVVAATKQQLSNAVAGVVMARALGRGSRQVHLRADMAFVARAQGLGGKLAGVLPSDLFEAGALARRSLPARAARLSRQKYGPLYGNAAELKKIGQFFERCVWRWGSSHRFQHSAFHDARLDAPRTYTDARVLYVS